MTETNKTSSSSEIISSGKQANVTGNALERFVEHVLTEHDYTEFINHKDQVFAMRHTIGGKQYSKQPYCGQSIYDTARRCDFLVFNQNKFPEGLVIECKWQQVAGSVDEKYPFAVHNIMKIGVPTIILIDGGGYKKAASEWLKRQADPNRALIGVYTMAEFQCKTNNGFLG